MSRAIKPDAQPFDEIRIKTIPRFKESELSGDEWRISSEIHFFRNGVRFRVVGGYSNVESAVKALGWEWMRACNKAACYAGEAEFCDQEGCSEKALVAFKKKADYCNQGHRNDTNGSNVRMFCFAHSARGDSCHDDSQSNYDLLSR